MEFSEDQISKEDSENGSVCDGVDKTRVCSKNPQSKKLRLDNKEHSNNNDGNFQSNSSSKPKVLDKASPKLVTHEEFRQNSLSSDVLSMLEQKQKLWEDTKVILKCLEEEPVCFIGDFNWVRSASERLNCNYQNKATEMFNDLVSDCNLLELDLLNAKFTWFGGDLKKSRLDRAFINTHWSQLRGWKLTALAKKQSDHKPLFLNGSILEENSKKPFKVFNCHLNKELSEEVQKVFNLSLRWEGFKNQLDLKIVVLEHLMNKLEDAGTDLDRYQKVNNHLKELYKKKDSMFRQKSRMDWIDLSDGNTKFFHQFFKNNHSELLGLGSLVLSSLSSSSKSFLVSYISEQEMEIALHDLSDNKAPGPDGMNIKSLKFLWPFIKDKMSGFIGNFCNSCTLPPGVNSFFIALVPKIPNPVTIKDFRPISLINSSIKVLLKILTSRLATQMSTLVADNQTGFFKGRKAAESILVAK
ncbi:hypothetical protein DCAR_0205908 [Daucus carota subsp. sativus]|uniref:Reverse transcriptase domain-containing protein n=1 Tax=Daucus carota subsp. sativus TaxID=79200 RepID=A0AAF0WB54_DAUCS|nr:PREDICTED: uncharacterized protein LOC108207258 [Daucus carota subsp. sativus]WOG86690.1 hypothetical protein DCAR_0205908 [Daucus carota subsp. sativus]